MSMLLGGLRGLPQLSNYRSLMLEQVRYSRKQRHIDKYLAFNQYIRNGMTTEKMLEKPTTRRMLMRRLLKEWTFIAWGHDNFAKPDKRLNYPL